MQFTSNSHYLFPSSSRLCAYTCVLISAHANRSGINAQLYRDMSKEKVAADAEKQSLIKQLRRAENLINLHQSKQQHMQQLKRELNSAQEEQRKLAIECAAMSSDRDRALNKYI